MKEKCDTLGHDWRVTAAPGWYQCVREVGFKLGRFADMPGKVVYCHAMGHCPGCLGYVLHGTHVVMCHLHSSINLQRLPVKHASPHQAFSSYTAEQQTLW
ncbi:hypothetical protein [Dictyobacter aurantiacus]|uniref:Uncharacterized protein n=1 Tax=Dictyobacter aurantiacus TaxID=1936993 RepID=A0A401ZFH9_9CHLR|nr:hypothetical protein [Dictyobacter aurantiacus]GCE05609.1 hypothetical protein KDAU_29380 [Dictyobacter aurantiacus]